MLGRGEGLDKVKEIPKREFQSHPNLPETASCLAKTNLSPGENRYFSLYCDAGAPLQPPAVSLLTSAPLRVSTAPTVPPRVFMALLSGLSQNMETSTVGDAPFREQRSRLSPFGYGEGVGADRSGCRWGNSLQFTVHTLSCTG